MPKLLKVTLNMGLGEAVNDSKVIQLASEQLSLISGQLPVVTKAKKSIATFKIRTGMPLGVKVTLRGNRMYEFVDRLTTIALPRIRDFRGLSNKGFDGRGNYSFGIKELTIFPEILIFGLLTGITKPTRLKLRTTVLREQRRKKSGEKDE